MKMIELIFTLSFSLLSFFIVYGILNKIKIFERSVNLLISVITSLFTLFALEYYQDLLLKVFSSFILLIVFVFIVLSYFSFFRSKNQAL